MTQKELVNQFCEFRGKLTTDDVVALNFAYKTLVPQGMGRMTKEEFIMAVEDWYLTGNEDSITFLGGLFDKVTQPQWISVEDELPPKKSEYDDLSNNVLATDGKEVYESVYDYDFEDWSTHDMWGLENITHWMPKPVPPSSSEKPNNCEKGGDNG